MKKLLFLGIVALLLTLPVSADIAIPEVPPDAADIFPQDTTDAGNGLLYIFEKALDAARPQIGQSLRICLAVVAAAILLSVLRGFEGKSKAFVEFAGVAVVAILVAGSADSMIETGLQTVRDIGQYSKLLLPAMTAALAAQGGSGTAAALYGATALFDTLLSNLISAVAVPMVYVCLILSIVNALSQDGALKRLKDLSHWAVSRLLRIILYAFTGYIAVTGVIGGTADQVAIKATKMTISAMVPVVGGILSDASETVLVSAAVIKNSVGVYGLLAIVAITALPFLRIGAHYLLLKLTAAVAGVFAPDGVTRLLEDMAACMALVLAMVGSICLMELIGVVCFLKGMT